MRPFQYAKARTAGEAVALTASEAKAPTLAPSQFLAGGTSLIDFMKLDVWHAERLVDINDLQAEYGEIRQTAEGLRLGALARMADVADHPLVLAEYPVIAQSLQKAASAQLRNMATLGGNVLQRSRCTYFRDLAWEACNKRTPGSGCAALEGVNRKHAVLGVNDLCISTYHGDFAQALVALDAVVEILGPDGPRKLRFEDLHTGPEHPEIETTLQPGELITGFLVPSGPWTARSTYLKIRDRESYEYGLATAAVAISLGPDWVVDAVRIGLGGVAYRPWRAHDAEFILTGKVLTQARAEKAAAAAFADARPRAHNAFKVELGQKTLVRALMQLADAA